MGSCNSKQETIVSSTKPHAGPNKKLDLVLNEMKESLDVKYRDMPEWDGML